jgi:hypothetical protein
MHHRAQVIYYGLAIAVLGTGLFMLQPNQSSEVSAWQQSSGEQLSIAWQQTIGDQPWFSEVELIFDSITGFYNQSASATIALIDQPETDQDIIYVYSQVYMTFAKAFNPNYGNQTAIAYTEVPLPESIPNFMSEEPLYNLVPYREVVKTLQVAPTPVVAGAVISLDQPVNSPEVPWVTMTDNLTGQLYCVAIYNGTVNQYLGACKHDTYY